MVIESTSIGNPLRSHSDGLSNVSLSDLQEVSALAAQSCFDHIVIESTGIGEPLPVAAAFAAVAPNGATLAEVAELDTMVRAFVRHVHVPYCVARPHLLTAEEHHGWA